MADKFAVIGLGRFGMTVATSLAEKGAEVLAIDISEDRVDSLRDEVAHAVTLDATDIKALKSQNIEEMDAVVVAIGRDFESMLLTTVHLIDLNIKRIIARAMNPTQRTILAKMGIEEIISPEVEVGITLAEQLRNPGILAFLQLPDSYEIAEVSAPQNIANRTVQDISLRKKYNLNLITIKRLQTEGTHSERHVCVPVPETVVEAEDSLLLMGKANDIKRFIEINN